MDTKNGNEKEENASVRNKRPENSKKRMLRSAIEIIIYVAILLAGVYLLPTYVVQRTIVDGDSMNDTLQTEDNLLVNKITYKIWEPERFDVVVFYPDGNKHPDTFFRFMKRLLRFGAQEEAEEPEDDYYIKRVIGLPGETVEIHDEAIYINGEILSENYGKMPTDYAGLAAKPITLGEDEYFVMGDNRGESRDSRDIGPVKKEDIDGKAILRIYPFSKFGTFD